MATGFLSKINFLFAIKKILQGQGTAARLGKVQNTPLYWLMQVIALTLLVTKDKQTATALTCNNQNSFKHPTSCRKRLFSI